MSLHSTSFRTFVLYPLLVIAWEWWMRGGQLRIQPWFAPLLAWGFLQYWLIGRYRARRGGGGPGMQVPPDRLVMSGPYAWCRNPMYLGHLIFLAGLALTLHSWPATALAVANAFWFHARVRRDERRLRELFGRPYDEYCSRVRRWGLL